MKKIYFVFVLSLFISMFSVKVAYGQYGTLKFCPGTPAWNANKAMVENEKEMYNEYAKGPDGCWYLKSAKFASYKEGYYQWNYNGKKYYYNKKKKFWENASRTECIPECPFGK